MVVVELKESKHLLVGEALRMGRLRGVAASTKLKTQTSR
jgi:hypothetical protein